MTQSRIEWTDRVWNPVIGCTPVSEGCRNCYAAGMARRLEAMGRPEYAPRVEPASMGTPYDPHTPERTIRIAEVRGGRPVFSGEVRTLPDRLAEPLKWRKPSMVFVNSMSDLFHDRVPFGFIDRVFAVMALCPWHTFQVLTKRPERMAEYLGQVSAQRDAMFCDAPSNGRDIGYWMSEHHQQRRDDPAVVRPTKDFFSEGWEPCSAGHPWPLPNVWLGTSVEDQATANARIPHLLRCRAAVRFLSCEPLLGNIDLGKWLDFGVCNKCGHMGACERSRIGLHHLAKNGSQCAYLAVPHTFIHWVIAGGESGPKARPMHPDWARSLRDQCAAAGVPFFFKQWGEWLTDVKSIMDRERGAEGYRRGHYHDWGGALMALRVGKKAAGDLLDGVRHHHFPAAFPAAPAAGSGATP